MVSPGSAGGTRLLSLRDGSDPSTVLTEFFRENIKEDLVRKANSDCLEDQRSLNQLLVRLWEGFKGVIARLQRRFSSDAEYKLKLGEFCKLIKTSFQEINDGKQTLEDATSTIAHTLSLRYFPQDEGITAPVS